MHAFEGLTRKQRQLARFMLDNRVQLAFASAEEAGRGAGVDAATVVRFSRLLGYEGYADLRDSVRSAVPDFATAAEKMSRVLARLDQGDDLIAQVFAQDIHNVEETARVNPPQVLKKAATILSRSAETYVLGLGMSAAVAENLVHQLSLMGRAAHRISGDPVAATADVSGVGPKDVLVAVSLWRYLKDTDRLFRSGRESGAKTIVLTDSKGSPLAAEADVVIVAATSAAELSHSLTSLMTLTNLLASAVALDDPERTLARLRKIDDFYDRFDVMAE